MAASRMIASPLGRYARAWARHPHVRGGLGSGLVKVAQMGLGLAVAVVLARILGAAGYGIYTYVLTLISVLVMAAQCGLPQLLVRETARAHAAADWPRLAGLWRWSATFVTATTLVLAALAGVAASTWFDLVSGEHLTTFLWGLLLLPLIALTGLRDAMLRGLHHVVQGQLGQPLLRPLLLLTLLAGVIIVGTTRPTPADAMALHVVAAAGALVIIMMLQARARPVELDAVSVPVRDRRRWLTSALPLGLVAGGQFINNHADILMLGWFAPAADVGVYRVVVQVAMLTTFGLAALNMVLAPEFARLHAGAEHERLQRLVTVSARCILVGTLPLAAGLVIFAGALLGGVFGAEYGRGETALIILTGGQLLNVGFGSVGQLLAMTRYERDVARGVAGAALANIALNAALIPLYGMTGAASATALTLGLWNILLWRLVRRRLGIDSTAFGRVRPRDQADKVHP